MSERITVVLENGVSAMLLKLAGSSRKQGEYLSRVIKALYAGEVEMKAGNDLEALRLGFAGMLGKQKELEGRVMQLERQVAAMIAQHTS